MKELLKKLLQSGYARNIITLVSGASLSQVILLLITPILTRIFTPDDFGIYASFFAVVSILVLIVTGRYEVAILLPKKDREAVQLFEISMGLALVFCALLYFVLPYLLSLLERYSATSFYPLRFWLPPTIFLLALVQAAGFLANRDKRYKLLSYSRITGSGSTGLASILLGLAKLTKSGLIFGKIIGLILEAMVLVIPLRSIFKTQDQTKLSYRALIKKYRNFPLFSVPEALVNTSYRQLPILLLTSLFSPASAGFYSLAHSIVSRPLGMIGSSFMQVFFQRAAELNEGTTSALENLFVQNFRALFLLAFLPCLLLALVAPGLFEFILGDGWRTTGIYTQWLMPLLFFSFLKSPLSAMVDIKNKIGANIFFELTLLLLAILAFFIGFRQNDPLLAVKIYSLSCSFVVAIQLWWFYKLTKIESSWNT